MYFDIQYRLGTALSGEDARNRIAAANGRSATPIGSELFHYDAKGSPLPGYSPFKFCGTRSGFRIVALGEAGADWLAANGHRITRLLASERRMPVQEIRQSGEIAIDRLPYQLAYEAPGIVIQKKTWQRDRLQPYFDQPNHPLILEHTAGVIRRSIAKQAAFLGLDAAAVDALDVKVCAIDRLRSIPLKPGASAHFLKAGTVAFTLNARLHGWWFLGYLSSRGQGVINGAMQRAQMAVRAAEAR